MLLYNHKVESFRSDGVVDISTYVTDPTDFELYWESEHAGIDTYRRLHTYIFDGDLKFSGVHAGTRKKFDVSLEGRYHVYVYVKWALVVPVIRVDKSSSYGQSFSKSYTQGYSVESSKSNTLGSEISGGIAGSILSGAGSLSFSSSRGKSYEISREYRRTVTESYTIGPPTEGKDIRGCVIQKKYKFVVQAELADADFGSTEETGEAWLLKDLDDLDLINIREDDGDSDVNFCVKDRTDYVQVRTWDV